MGPAASCHLWWVVVESSSFAPGCAGWALRRLRGWVIRVWQIAERFCLGLAREPSGPLGVLQRRATTAVATNSYQATKLQQLRERYLHYPSALRFFTFFI